MHNGMKQCVYVCCAFCPWIHLDILCNRVRVHVQAKRRKKPIIPNPFASIEMKREKYEWMQQKKRKRKKKKTILIFTKSESPFWLKCVEQRIRQGRKNRNREEMKWMSIEWRERPLFDDNPRYAFDSLHMLNGLAFQLNSTRKKSKNWELPECERNEAPNATARWNHKTWLSATIQTIVDPTKDIFTIIHGAEREQEKEGAQRICRMRICVIEEICVCDVNVKCNKKCQK